MPETSTAVALAAPVSLMARFAERFQIEPSKLAATLKATAFHTSDKPITDEQLAMLVIVANQYNLNPFLRQIYAYPDRGRIVPVVGVDGWISLVQSHPQFDGWSFDWDAAEQAMSCTVVRKDRSIPTVVTEYLAECRRKTDAWDKMPRRMMRNRAMAQAARVAFGFTGIHTEDEAQAIVAAGKQAPEGKGQATTAERVKRAAKGEPIPAAEVVEVEVAEVDDFPSALPTFLARCAASESPTELDDLLSESISLLNSEDYAALTEAAKAKSVTFDTEPEQDQ